MVKVRLKRLGRKKRPFYRIVVMDVRARRDGAALAQLGYYNPLSRELKLDKLATVDWQSKGALLSPAVERLLKLAPDSGELIVLDRPKKERLSKKAQARQQQQEEAKAQPAAETEAPQAEVVEASAPEAKADAEPAEESEETQA